MALADVLSAMREIILDAPALPAEAGERQRIFIERFPDLSQSELEDLACIEPAKFSIYTTSIFQAEKGILENHMPITFALFKQHWTEAYHEKFIGRRIPQRLHLVRPWESQSPRVFLENFVQFVNHDCPQLIALRPDLGAIARLEGATYTLKRAADSTLTDSERAIPVTELAGITVSDLLQATLHLKQPVHALETSHAVLAVREHFNTHQGQLTAASADALETFLVGTRRKNNAICWIATERATFNFIEQLLGSETPSTVDDFAAALLQDNPLSESPQAALEYLIRELSMLIASEIVAIVPADHS